MEGLLFNTFYLFMYLSLMSVISGRCLFSKERLLDSTVEIAITNSNSGQKYKKNYKILITKIKLSIWHGQQSLAFIKINKNWKLAILGS